MKKIPQPETVLLIRTSEKNRDEFHNLARELKLTYHELLDLILSEKDTLRSAYERRRKPSFVFA